MDESLRERMTGFSNRLESDSTLAEHWLISHAVACGHGDAAAFSGSLSREGHYAAARNTRIIRATEYGRQRAIRTPKLARATSIGDRFQ